MTGGDPQPVIGLEIHCQLATGRRLFSATATDYGAPPNTRVGAYDVAMPGTLPVVDAEAVNLALRAGIALGCEIHRRSRFDRKHYFYPDLPKGYQITQYYRPLCTEGELVFDVDGDEKKLSIRRIHLEEDAGKSIHDAQRGRTLVDYNRAGHPLIEIVTEPELRSPEEAEAAMRALHRLVVHLGVSDGNLEEGSFRCDANVSVRRGEDVGPRTELKNLNSFRFVRRALRREIERHRRMGGDDTIEWVDETRRYDADADRTVAMRTKETSPDYRYVPDPDLPPLVVSDEVVDGVRRSLPQTPRERKKRWIDELELSTESADVLIDPPERAEYFEQAISTGKEQAQSVANLIVNELLQYVGEGRSVDDLRVGPEDVARVSELLDSDVLSFSAASTVLARRVESEASVDAIVDRLDLRQIIDEDELTSLVDGVLEDNPSLVDDYRGGKKKLFGHFMGLVMGVSKGRADPKRVSRILREKLEEPI